ncbi:MAG: hypothetical protein JO121_22740 [Deltaproteobacteria bacterium]|nr:hypothetical protein [Deltaproteobacteria bacterium]
MALHRVFRHHLNPLDCRTERILLLVELSYILIEMLFFAAAAERNSQSPTPREIAS